MAEIGRTLLLLAAVLAVVGGGLLLGDRLGLGRLPGDIVVKNERVTFVFPLVTSLVVSVVLTLLLNLFLRRGGS